jgi:hypothetical protein
MQKDVQSVYVWNVTTAPIQTHQLNQEQSFALATISCNHMMPVVVKLLGR